MQTALAESWIPPEPDIMDVEGRLDGQTASIFQEDCLLCIESGARRMALDCGGLSYISSAGLQAFMIVAAAMQKREGRLVVCDLQPQVEEMFAATGLHSFIPVHPDRDDALLALAG